MIRLRNAMNRCRGDGERTDTRTGAGARYRNKPRNQLAEDVSDLREQNQRLWNILFPNSPR